MFEPDLTTLRPPSERNAFELENARRSSLVATAQEQGAQLGLPFSQYTIDLATSGLDTAGYRIAAKGQKLIYRREGSAPSGRLHVDVGGRLLDLYPGASIKVPFEGLTVFRSERSGAVGNAKLIVCSRGDVDFIEPQTDVAGEDLTPVDLLGAVGAGTFVAVAEDTQPSGAAPTGSFVHTGWKKLRVTIDGQAANTLTETDIIWWTREPNSGVWFEQGESLQHISDSQATGYRYRTFTINVTGNGRMCPEIRTLLPAAQTQLGFAIQGIE